MKGSKTMPTQLELFENLTLDKRRGYYLLPRYKKAIPQGDAAVSTIDLFLAERGNWSTSLGDVPFVTDTRENLLAKGYSFLTLLKNYTSSYESWRAKVYPTKCRSVRGTGYASMRRIETPVYDI